MKYFFVLLISIFFLQCQTARFPLKSTTDCGDYQYGSIYTTRKVNDEDRVKLDKYGVHIEEFISENVYAGYFPAKFNMKKLRELPVKKLVPQDGSNKLSSGMQMSELEKMAKTGQSFNVIAQTFGPVTAKDLAAYGKVEQSMQNYFRLKSSLSQIKAMHDMPCIRSIHIMTETEPNPDTPFQEEKTIKVE